MADKRSAGRQPGTVGPGRPQVLAVDRYEGRRLEVTRHLLLQQRCSCGHVSAARGHVEPPDEPLWPKVALSEQRLLGPHLPAMVVYLSMRMQGSRSKVQELMLAMFGLAGLGCCLGGVIGEGGLNHYVMGSTSLVARFLVLRMGSVQRSLRPPHHVGVLG
jgi:hypothetical protein